MFGSYFCDKRVHLSVNQTITIRCREAHILHMLALHYLSKQHIDKFPLRTYLTHEQLHCTLLIFLKLNSLIKWMHALISLTMCIIICNISFAVTEAITDAQSDSTYMKHVFLTIRQNVLSPLGRVHCSAE